MSRRKPHQILTQVIPDSTFLFSNLLLRSPVQYTLMERRFLYKLASCLKMRYKEMGLSIKDNWYNLVFKISKKDLADVGGPTHIDQTFEIIRSLADRSVIQFFKNEKKETILGFFHWIEAFYYNTNTKDYTVRVSHELYEYVAGLTNNFSGFDLNVGIQLNTIYSQKFYELGCVFTSGKGNFRFTKDTNSSEIFKERVLKLSFEALRFIMGLSEIHDPQNGKLIGEPKYSRYAQVEERVLRPSQNELYTLYKNGSCNLWFDYSTDRSGRGQGGGSVTAVYLYFYTNEHPKSQDPIFDRPWQDGDEPLCPFENKQIGMVTVEKPKTIPIAEPFLFEEMNDSEQSTNQKIEGKKAAEAEETEKATKENTSADKKEEVDYKAFMTYFNSQIEKTHSKISKMRVMSAKRKEAIGSLCHEYGKNAVVNLIQKAVKSDFLNGKAQHRDSQPFVASIDWLLIPGNFIKVIEGNYDNKRKASYF